MAQAHNIVRLDRMSGTYDGANLYSVMVVDRTANDEPIAVDNGTYVSITNELVDGEREVFLATVVEVGDTSATNIALVASPEVVYDERKDSLADFENEAGVPARAYLLDTNDIWSVSFNDEIAETEAAKYTVGSSVNVGTHKVACVAKESEGYDVVLKVTE